MVFLLEDMASIELNRIMTDDKLTDTYEFVQDGAVFGNSLANQAITQVMNDFVAFSEEYEWKSKARGILSVYSDAFLNAGMWGNQDMPGKRIQTKVKYGLYGGVIYVSDEGSGFDYKSQIAKLHAGDDHDFNHHGGGMRKFFRVPFDIAYHELGRTISIATQLSPEVLQSKEYQRYLDHITKP